MPDIDKIVPANPGFSHVHFPSQQLEIFQLQTIDDNESAEGYLIIHPIVAWLIYNTGKGVVAPITIDGESPNEGENGILCPNGLVIGFSCLQCDGNAYSSLEEFAEAACRNALQTYEDIAAEEGITIDELAAKWEGQDAHDD